MLIYNLIEQSKNHSKKSKSVWKKCKDMTGEADNLAIRDSAKSKITGKPLIRVI